MADRKQVNGRVGMLVHASYPVDVRVRRQAECLVDKGFEVHVVCCRDPLVNPGHDLSSYEIIGGVHVHRLPLRKSRGNKLRYLLEYTLMTLLGLLKITRLSLKKRFDVVHVHNMPDSLVMAGLLSRLAGSILVLDVHDPMSELFQENYQLEESHFFLKALRLQERVCYGLASHLVTVNDSMTENVAKKLRCSKDAITVVHNFPDLNWFPIREDRERWPYSKDDIVFLYAGTVTQHYRLDIAIRAFAEVSRSIPNIRFQLLGVGNIIHELLSLAVDLGIGDRVELLTPVKGEEVKNIMANADVGITTHQSGVFGDLCLFTKILEYMTQGLPVISSRTNTVERYIPEEAIFYFEPGREEDLAKTILFMIENPSVVLEKIQNAKKLVSRYNWQDESENFIAFYRELVNRRRSARHTSRTP